MTADNDKVTISINELYNLLWEEPISIIAKKFRISDSELRAICKWDFIPYPKSEYWTNPHVRKKTPKDPLQYSDDEGKRKLTITPSGMEVDGKFVIMSPQELKEKEIVKALGRMPTVPSTLRLPDKLVEFTRDVKLNKISWQAIEKSSLKSLAIKVEPQNLERALIMFQALIEVLKERGHTFVDNCVYANDQKLELYICERGKVDPTKKMGNSRSILYDGSLQVKVGPGYREKCFTDGKVKIEEQLLKIVAYIELDTLHWFNYFKKLEEKRAEEKRVKLKELEGKKRIFQDFANFKKLLFDAKRHDDVQKIREYIRAVKCEENEKLSVETANWIEWADQKADWYDPLLNKDFPYEEYIKENRQSHQPSGYSAYNVNTPEDNYFQKQWYEVIKKTT